MRRFLENLDKYLKYYFLVSIVFLAFGLWLLYQRVDLISKVLQQKFSDFPQTVRELKEVKVETVDVCNEECQKMIEVEVAKATATLSAVQTPAKTGSTYISLDGPFTTTSTDWVNLQGVEAYIDLEKDYGKAAKVSWEASLKVAHGNGQAFARLFDVTHGIAVSGSEISTVNNATSQQAPSGDLNLWSGRNLYRVQIKSLNSFEVTFGGGRIKISY